MNKFVAFLEHPIVRKLWGAALTAGTMAATAYIMSSTDPDTARAWVPAVAGIGAALGASSPQAFKKG